MRKGRIYCCFSGTGKTQADVYSLVIDLERHFYNGDVSWEKVIDVAVMITELGRDVALGSDLFLRRKLRRKEIPYTVVIPSPEDKEIYRQRYISRNNEPEHVIVKCDNWEVLLSEKLDGEEIETLPSDGNLTQYFVEKARDEDNKIMNGSCAISAFVTERKLCTMADLVIWEMDITEELVSALNSGSRLNSVERIGDVAAPTFTRSNNHLVVSRRGANWHSIDIHLGGMGLTDKNYRLTVEGDGATNQLQLNFLLNGVPCENGTVTGTNVLTMDFTCNIPTSGNLTIVPPKIRISTSNGGTDNFTIRRAKIERLYDEGSNNLGGIATAWKEVIDSPFFGRRGAGTTLTPTDGGILVGNRAKNLDGFAIDILGLRQFVAAMPNRPTAIPTIVIEGIVEGILGDIEVQGFTSEYAPIDDGNFIITIESSDEFDGVLAGDWPHAEDWLWETGWDAGLNQTIVLSSMIRAVRNGTRPAIVLTTVGNPHPQPPPPHSLGNYTITSITVDGDSIFKILDIE